MRKSKMKKHTTCASRARLLKTNWSLRRSRKGVQNQNGVCADCTRMFSGKTSLRKVRKGGMKRKGFAAKDFFRNFAEKWRYDVITK